MSFVNLQVALEDLPRAADIAYEAMSDQYEKEVRTQQLIIWLPLLLASLVPILIVMIGFPDQRTALKVVLGAIPVIVSLLAAFIATLVIRQARVKGIALREHDVAFRKGLFWRNTVLLPYNRIQHVEVSNGPLQRRFGLASLKLFTAGGNAVDLNVAGLDRERAEEIRSFILDRNQAAEA